MQRLAKPSDYVLQDVLGQSMYVLPWEPCLCPGNPTHDPEEGAVEYNTEAIKRAQGAVNPPLDEVEEAVQWVLNTPGDAARTLAANLAAAYQGDYVFRLEDLETWDAETKKQRATLAFRNAELRRLSARQVMSLRARSAAI